MPPLNFQPNTIQDTTVATPPAPLFVPAQEVKTKPSFLSNLAGKAKDLFSSSDTIDLTKNETAPTIKAPKVVASRKDLYSPIKTLDVGIPKVTTTGITQIPVEVRTPPARLQSTLDITYKNNPDIPKGLLEALLMKESSMGATTTSKNSKIGDFAYLTGFTNTAKSELIRNGYHPDLNTPQGVLQATADFIKLKKDIKDVHGNVTHTYNDWTKFYNERYSSGKLKPEDLQTFSHMLNYYAS